MVQVIQSQNKRQGTDWGQALVGAIGIGAGAYDKYKQKQELAKENNALKAQGIELTGLTGKTREMVLAHKLKSLDESKEFENIANEFGGQNKGIPGFEETGQEGKSKFNFSDPYSWTDKEVDKVRSIKASSPKAQSFAKAGEVEYERRQALKKEVNKYREDTKPLEGALETIAEMRKIGSKGNLGIGSSITSAFNPETRKDVGRYEQLGKSLISYASTIPIRNKLEFETLSHDLFDSSLSDAKREGILAAMEKIVRNSLESYSRPEGMESGSMLPESVQPQQQERPPLTSFIR